MDDSFQIDSIESVYNGLNDNGEIKKQVQLMLWVRNWLTQASSFDPVSGHALNTDIVDFLDVVSKFVGNASPEDEIKDRIYRLVSHTKEAVLAIMEHTRDKILREHAMLPIHAAREVDSNSVQWLSRQPGRTLREKLSGKPYMKAVRRSNSVDTAENRLLRAFLFRLEQILVERQNVLSVATKDSCEELLVSLQRWFKTEDAAEIGNWGNLPPNNTLLQDKRYRKVWDAWLWLQSIDEKIIGDSKRLQRDILAVIYWSTLSLLNRSGRFRAAQQPIVLDYDDFSLAPQLPVRGYLFPLSDSKSKGKIKFIKPDKLFGFITSEDGSDLFFHKNNLSRKLDICSLTAGDEVSFIIGNNQQGECADDITLPAGIIFVDFNLKEDKWTITVGSDKYLLQVVSGSLLIEKTQDVKKILKIESSTLKGIPNEILSFVMDSQLEYSDSINSQSGPIWVESSVVDLCSIRPRFTNNTGSQTHLPFRLLQQHWPLKINGELEIDCGYAKSIVLHSDIETVSMRSLFSHSSTLPDATKSSASMFFTKKLSDYIKADKLTYLVPDWGNDFALEGIRRSINFYFNEATPLPKSIATIFAWQSSKKFVQDRVREKDFVLVVDSFDGGISITPVKAIYQKELHEILPETQGISWERHPTVIVPNKSIHDAVVRNLASNGCQTPQELFDLFGFDGLASDAGKTSFVNDNDWYHLPSSIREILTQGLELNLLSNKVIQDSLNYTKGNCRGVGVFILPLEDIIRKPNVRMGYKWLGSAWSPIKGCQTLNRWQDEVDDIALWCDHLPELSVRIVRDGHFENFYLVKDATVTSQSGRTVNIPLEELFTLPAGQTHYSFPLQQGKGNEELQFVAYLKSPALPLKKDTVCKLKMTYTYGADEPYELKFIPLDSAEAGFKSIRVEWRSVSEGKETVLENLPVPDFPNRKSWLDFQKFPKPKEDGKKFSDLLGWLEKEMEQVSNIFDFLEGNRSTRIYDDDVVEHWEWKEDRNGKQFCVLRYDFGDAFFHESNFEQFDPEADEISFDLEEQRSREGYVARNITLGKSVSKRTVEHFRKSLRFPALTIWNHDHSLSDSDVPEHFRKAIFKGTKNIISIIESEIMPDTLKEELFFFLCCLHKDAPEIVYSRLLEAVKDNTLLKNYRRQIALAIGNAEMSWQQELLASVINPIDNKGLTISITMEILSIALWRSRALINKFSYKELEKLNKDLYCCLEFDIKNIMIEAKGHRHCRRIETLCRHLEALLAFLRTRENDDEEIRRIMTPDRKLTKKYVKLIDDFSKIVKENNILLNSRINLQVDKPEIFSNSPDLLYALRMFLTGEKGANSISITSIQDD